MQIARSALAVAYEFAWKCGIIVIAVALLAAMPAEDRKVASSASSRTVSPIVISNPEGDTTEVSMAVAAESLFSNCSLLDEDGKELLHVQYSRNGSLWVKWGDAFPFQPRCTSTRDGAFEAVILDRETLYRLRLRPAGVSGFTISGTSLNETYGLGITQDGELVNDPSVIE